MPDPYIGEIQAFPYTYAPDGWLQCSGQQLPIAQFQLLFAIIGTIYGGDGRNSFRLPNLSGSAPMGAGRGPGLDNVVLSQRVGENSKSLDDEQLPPHVHVARAEIERTENAAPADSYVGILLSSEASGVMAYKQDTAAPVAMSSEALRTAGGSQLYDNRQPFLAIRYCINFDGTFPQKS